MQPTQLSLLPDQVPAPPTQILDELPGPDVAVALEMLARLIAQAACPRPGDRTGDGDE